MSSPSSKRATNRKRSSITELSFHGINTSCQMTKSVTHVSGTNRYLSLEPLIPFKRPSMLTWSLGKWHRFATKATDSKQVDKAVDVARGRARATEPLRGARSLVSCQEQLV